jgi:uncharacterized protein (DUF1697 family)
MTEFAAFLRGVNLGKRSVKSADLIAAFGAMGFPGARTLIASGNVLFEAEDVPDLRSRIETGLGQKFGFDIGTVLRSRAQLQAMIASDPFAGRAETEDTKLYVTMLATPDAGLLAMPCAIPGDFTVVRATDRDIYHEGYRMPDGRFGASATLIGKPFGKKILWTNRNWNTILRAISA